MVYGTSALPLSEQMLAEWRGNPDALIQIILQQGAAIVALQEQVRELQSKLAERQAPPPAAPFRRDPSKRKSNPGRPGRKPGHPGSFRQKPEVIDQVIEVPLPEDSHCPDCRVPLAKVRKRTQYIEEIIPARAQVTELTTWQGYCPNCQREFRSTHPLKVSEACGAAGVHLGPRAQAMAAALKYDHGLSWRKTQRILQQLFQLQITPGALSQSAERVARRLHHDYDQLLEQLRAGPFVHSDETSWWVNEPGWSLWVFCRPDLTYYRVVPSRSRAQFHEIIPADYPGVLVSDCLSVYDGATAHQHKCYAHHQKAIGAAIEDKGCAEDPGAWLNLIRRLLQQAVALSQQRHQLSPELFEKQLSGLRIAARALLNEPLPDAIEESVRMRLFKQRDHLFSFLEHPGVSATNNLAERQLRPAVITRKVSCGNRTAQGAGTWQVLASLAATCHQRANSLIDLVIRAVSLHPPHISRPNGLKR